MIPQSFEYKRAESVADAISLMKDNPAAKILAGGHSLIPALKLRLNAPPMLVDISRIKDLDFIRDRGKYIAIGANTTHGTIASHKTTTQKLPLLAMVAGLIGDVQVRNKGTIGGSIAHADPAADWPAALMAADATIVVEGAFGERKIPALEFFKGFFYTELREGEIITEIHVPEPDPSVTRFNYYKFAQPASRFALAACAVQLTMDGDKVASARIAFNGVSSSAYRNNEAENYMIGKELNQQLAKEAANGALAGAEMVMSDHYADETYRTQLAMVVCERAINGCVSGC